VKLGCRFLTFGALLLLVAGYWFWTRGTASSWRERLGQARDRISAPSLARLRSFTGSATPENSIDALRSTFDRRECRFCVVLLSSMRWA